MNVEISVTEGSARGQFFSFDKPDCFLFGRAKDARLSLPNDPYVSRQHFLIEITPIECTVTDLGSKNGLFVNSVRYGGRKPPDPGVEQAPVGQMCVKLNDGDVITVGNTVMRVSIKSVSVCGKCGGTIPGDLIIKSADTICGFICPKCLKAAEEKAKPKLKDTSGSSYGKDSSGSIRMLESILKQAASPYKQRETQMFMGYRLEKQIGQGNMGTVYKAVDELTGMPVAIKTMKPQLAAKKENLLMFRREVEVTRQLKHKNIVELFDYGKSDGTFFFVIEYVDGMSLEDLFGKRNGKLDIKEAAPIMIGSLKGLAHAHRVKIRTRTSGGGVKIFRGIVHRDIKPDNILLTRYKNRWIPKISDFGLSKSFESAGLSGLTMPGMVGGTPVYWPREQITHYRYLNPATDVFSIAAVFYEVLTGYFVRKGFKKLFARFKMLDQSPGIPDFMLVLAENPPIPIRERDGNIPGPLAEVIDRALAETEVPSEKSEMRKVLAAIRYPDAGAFLKELAGAFKKIGFTI